MKVGIFLTNQNPLGTDMVSALDEQFAMTRLARDRGWDAVGTGQHYLSEGMSQLQLIPFLSRLAAEAGEMTGVAGVLLINLHNPVEVAECIASLDVIWRGNFVFGVGLGYREVEFDAFKVPKGQRLKRFEEQFPEALDLLSRAIRAGHAFQTAMGMVADELPEPVGPEFKKTFDQQNFGLPLKDALNELAERVGLLDVRFFVTAVLIQRDTGGNLSEILDNLAHVVR